MTPYQRGIEYRNAGRFNPLGFLTPLVPRDIEIGTEAWHRFIEGWCDATCYPRHPHLSHDE